MEMQLRRGLMEACILAVLYKQDSYGYKIVKDVCKYIKISESTLYPILRRLEENESLTVYSVEHNSRLRKYYKITNAGKEKINSFLNEWEEVMVVYNFISEEVRDNKE